jgi:hypothetical protein
MDILESSATALTGIGGFCGGIDGDYCAHQCIRDLFFSTKGISSCNCGFCLRGFARLVRVRECGGGFIGGRTNEPGGRR